jgi:hypothetical protein
MKSTKEIFLNYSRLSALIRAVWQGQDEAGLNAYFKEPAAVSSLQLHHTPASSTVHIFVIQ